MVNIFEQNGFVPGQKIIFEGVEMTVDSCWQAKEVMPGLKEKTPALVCHYLTKSGFQNFIIQENQIEKIEKVNYL